MLENKIYSANRKKKAYYLDKKKGDLINIDELMIVLKEIGLNEEDITSFLNSIAVGGEGF